MHEVRFRDPAGAIRTGRWDDDGVHFGGRSYDRDAVDVLPPCEPTKLVCIGRNYAEHADEMDSDVPDRPLLFLKGPNAVAGHGDTVTLPASKRVDHEAELAVVVGRQCRNVGEADAMDVVAGYTCGVDLSNRDDQRREQNWVRGKAFDGASPLGPVLAPPGAVPDDAAIELRVNGETRQSSSIAKMIFSVPELLAEITELVTLEPGHVVLTGTPEGAGQVTDGDRVAVEIEGVGTLEHRVEQAE
jgi:2-keto-4-pentenoate hydratase/2-oxohepta-3-ene-1,7-dioic acid hydratase in catechol pathway